MQRTCKKCGESKEENEDNFHRDGRNIPNKYRSLCKVCYLLDTNEDRTRRTRKNWKEMGFDEKPPRKKIYKDSQDRHLRKKYGISIYEYNILLEQQNHKCYICERPETMINVSSGKVQKLSVDHCHNSRQVRKLLCNVCNTSMGKMGENSTYLRNMANYIEFHSPTYEIPVGWC